MTLPLALAMALAAAPSPSSPPVRAPQPSAGALELMLDRLLVVGNVLYVAAHPDDENTRFLAAMASGLLWRTGYLSITRGDGGQNLVGTELGPLLGLIRTQELLAARGVDGAEQLFTRARDFGFSKSPEEALRIWGHDDVLADTVLAIRRFRPDVIVTRFDPDGSGTHGHHTASARLAREAFARAADPAYMPGPRHRELGPWKPVRVVWNAWNGPRGNTASLEGLPTLDVGGYSPQLGASYGELAGDSRSMHKSQGFGASRRRGPAPEYFKLLDGQPMKRSPLDGVEASWKRVPGSSKVVAALTRARAAFRPSAPQAAIPALLQARKAMLALAAHPWKEQKLAELEEVLVACAGLYAEVVAEAPSTSPGAVAELTVSVVQRNPGGLKLSGATLAGEALLDAGALPAGAVTEKKVKFTVPGDTAPGQPYWLTLPPGEGLYPAADDRWLTFPEEAAPLVATFTVGAADGQTIAVQRAVGHKWVDPVLGERYRRLEVLPAVTVNTGRSTLLFPDAAPRTLTVTVSSPAGAQGAVGLELPAGFTSAPASRPFTLKPGASVEVSFQVTPPPVPTEGEARVVATAGGRRYERGLVRVDHPHIPVQTTLPPAAVRLVRADVVHAVKRIAYVPGPGDEVPDALRQAGYDVTLVPAASLSREPLDGYEAIVVGTRAYNTEPALQDAHPRLMAYVEAGGTMLVQYMTNSWVMDAPALIGPYPLTVGRGRVTDETAAVEASAHPAVDGPNTLTAGDWAGWVQERGLYFGEKWDPRYAAPLAMGDPGEEVQRGALLVARHGKGVFMYTGLSFFRQLPAGVPGAFRLFANLLDAGKAAPATTSSTRRGSDRGT